MRIFRIPVLLAIMLALTVSTTAQRALAPANTVLSDVRATDAIVNGGFESAGGSGWTPLSLNGFNPFCTNGGCSTHTARTGTGFAWFGGDGAGPADEITKISQNLNLSPDKIVTLSFYLYRPTATDSIASADSFSVSFFGQQLFMTTSAVATYGSGYTLVTIDLTPYSADFGLADPLEFFGHDTIAPLTSWLVDDISLTVRTTAGNVLVSGGFESAPRAPLSAAWSLLNTDGTDKVKCNNPTLGNYYAFHGDCAFRFKGSDTESTTLVQRRPGSVLNFPTVVASNDRWNLSWWAGGPNHVFMVASVKFKMEIACPRSASVSAVITANSAPLSVRAAAPSYVPRSLGEQQFPCNGTVKKIIVKLKNSAPSGKFYIDNVAFLAYQPITRGQGDALPVPPPAQ